MRGYTFVDYLTQGYLLFVAGVILVFRNQTVPEWTYLVAAHAGGVVLIHLLIQAHEVAGQRRWLDFLRHFYPVLLYTGFYRETGALNQMFVADYQDPFFIYLEQGIFGLQPSLAFMDRFPFLLVSEVFYAAYFSYYLMISGVGLALFIRGRAVFFHYVSVLSFVFYLCYAIYIFLPVMGPRAFSREIEGYRLPEEAQALAPAPTVPEAVQTGLFFHLMAFIYRHFEAPGAAFPSSHVAVAIVTLHFSCRYLRRIRHVHAVMVVLLCGATIYCRYHYVVDIVAGVLTAALLIPFGNWLYRRLGAPAKPALAEGTPPPSPEGSHEGGLGMRTN